MSLPLASALPKVRSKSLPDSPEKKVTSRAEITAKTSVIANRT